MVLMAVDEFFRQLGLTEIRRRSTSDDKPLRMVKTLLHELCKKKVGARPSAEATSYQREHRQCNACTQPL
jgi:hypothetical protein